MLRLFDKCAKGNMNKDHLKAKVRHSSPCSEWSLQKLWWCRATFMVQASYLYALRNSCRVVRAHTSWVSFCLALWGGRAKHQAIFGPFPRLWCRVWFVRRWVEKGSTNTSPPYKDVNNTRNYLHSAQHRFGMFWGSRSEPRVIYANNSITRPVTSSKQQV